MIYRKIYPFNPGREHRSRIIIACDEGRCHGEIITSSAVMADAAANCMIAALQQRDAVREHVRMHTIGDEVVEIGGGSGEGE